mmetsp:Transcript_23743/g.53711  ORF Transcript_23743/g.53711 Transcript_23743/m.53711 type:complete len:181 (+) Transcript_23743:165-707(+)
MLRGSHGHGSSAPPALATSSSAPTSNSTSTSALRTGLSGAVAGVVTGLIFYGLDSFKNKQQAGEKIRYSQLFRGALPLTLLISGPSYFVFFVVYQPLRDALSDPMGEGGAVLAASLVAAVPSSIVSVPADVLKKQLLLGGGSGGSGGSVEGSARGSSSHSRGSSGNRGPVTAVCAITGAA